MYNYYYMNKILKSNILVAKRRVQQPFCIMRRCRCARSLVCMCTLLNKATCSVSHKTLMYLSLLRIPHLDYWLSRNACSVQGKFIASILARGQIYAPIYMPAIMQPDYCNMGGNWKRIFHQDRKCVSPFYFLSAFLKQKQGIKNRIPQQKPLCISKYFQVYTSKYTPTPGAESWPRGFIPSRSEVNRKLILSDKLELILSPLIYSSAPPALNTPNIYGGEWRIPVLQSLLPAGVGAPHRQTSCICIWAVRRLDWSVQTHRHRNGTAQ